MNNVKQIVFNQVINDKLQIQHITDFLEMAVRHQKKDPKRKFRCILEELEMVEET